MMFNKVYLGATPISKIFLGDVPIKYGNNIVAIYTVDDIYHTSPTYVTGKADDWEETVVYNKNGTYTVTITASRGLTKISFENNTSLLSVDYLNVRNITDMSDMFYNCTNLQTLHLDDWSYDSISMIINVSSLPINDIGTIKSIHCKKEEADGLIAPENWEFSYPYNTIAIYTVNDKQKTSPTYIGRKADDWEEIVKDNGDGTYTVTITASYGPTCIDFSHEPKNTYDNSALLTVDYIDTSNITNMAVMFYGCQNLTSINIRNWNTSKVTSMGGMFYDCKSLTSLNTSNWNTSQVTNMNGMFYNCNSLTTLNTSNWDTSNVTTMEEMFQYCNNLTTIGDTSNWDTSNVTDMTRMFSSCESLTSINTSNWNTSKVTSMGAMFYKCWGLTSLDLSNWDTSKVGNMSHMFRYCKLLTSLDLSGWDTGKVGNMEEMFCYCNKLTTIGDVSNWDTGNVIYMDYMFGYCGKLESLDLSSWRTSQVTRMVAMFYECKSLTSLNLSIFDTSNVINMNHMLYNCDKLREIHLDNCSKSSISKIITSSAFPTNVISGATKTIYCSKENAAGLIAPTNWEFDYIEDHIVAIYTVNDSSKTSPDLVKGKADDWRETVVDNGDGTYKVTVTASYGPTRISFNSSSVNSNITLLSVDYIDTSNMTTMYGMFNNCTSLTSIDTSNWDTSNVTDMYSMFYDCTSLTSLDVSNFDTRNVTTMKYMFNNCTSLSSLDLSSFNTSKVTDMCSMFDGCTSLTSLDISIFDTSKVVYMSDMFSGCRKLHTLHLDDCSNSSISKIITSTRFPTNAISGVTKTIYCKKEEVTGLIVPYNWVFLYVS